MNFKYLTCFDDFYTDPTKIVHWAKSLKYYPPSIGEKWPGERTRNLRDIDKSFYNKFCSILFNSIGFISHEYRVTSAFQKIQRFHDEPNNILNKSWEHQDGAEAGGIIYLNQSPSPNSGTTYVEPNDKYSILKKKLILEDIEIIRFKLWARQKNLSTYERNLYEDRMIKYSKMFTPVIKVENSYNKLVFHDGQSWHKHSNFYIEKSNHRLVQVFFIHKR